MKAEILSFISPVLGSFMGVLANTIIVITCAVSSPDPDLAAAESEELSTGGLNSCGPDGGGIRATGWFGETEGRQMLTWRDTQTMETVLLLLGWISKEQNALEANGLVGAQSDADAKPEAAKVSRHLQAEGTHLLQALHGVIFYLLQGIVLGSIIHLLRQKGGVGIKAIGLKAHQELTFNETTAVLPERFSEEFRESTAQNNLKRKIPVNLKLDVKLSFHKSHD
ncbi:hypothetical protein EYF80_030878 [Liparis tanakae]|uniref:Uncharacterized protein n=1 Tax=Liparis tanakae TaxID=230148 RepID=A0A4Z2GZ31_9TELE|nr:hypothetical protein EYF80_030878 [Liparis tanakae]